MRLSLHSPPYTPIRSLRPLLRSISTLCWKRYSNFQMVETCFTFPPRVPKHATWVADPSCRGTFGIVSLCLSTLLICIWSSIHRDIPLQRLSGFRSLLRDTPLILVALFAPEFMTFFAIKQRVDAWRVVQFATGLDSFRAPSDEGRQKRWMVCYLTC